MLWDGFTSLGIGAILRTGWMPIIIKTLHLPVQSLEKKTKKKKNTLYFCGCCSTPNSCKDIAIKHYKLPTPSLKLYNRPLSQPQHPKCLLLFYKLHKEGNVRHAQRQYIKSPQLVKLRAYHEKKNNNWPWKKQLPWSVLYNIWTPILLISDHWLMWDICMYATYYRIRLFL